ncbi:OLC1v1003564C1 [Oldenlandia corymbosa var. corymbosa]|uniref:OLC1v1003564C1 n=1 Tax=Oldenlandia corymbosa var. corymbosa TaxID=529605 RepID=A0AAV1DAA9_OLDCO|nr:OLC1v1003564C1 [Oldenlandia corymbosa var. corymbosa]
MEVQGRHMYSSSDTNNMLRLHHPGFSLGGINPDLLSPHHHHSTPDFGVATGFRPPKPTAHMQDFPSNHINPGNPVSSPCPLIAPNPNLVAAQMEAHQLETDLLLTLQVITSLVSNQIPSIFFLILFSILIYW